MKENQDEIPKFIEHWKRIFKHRDFVLGFPYEKFGGHEDPAHATYTVTAKRQPCLKLWNKVNILSDGRLVPCDAMFDGQVVMGDTNITSIKEIWNSPEYYERRQKHIDGLWEELKICDVCDSWYREVGREDFKNLTGETIRVNLKKELKMSKSVYDKDWDWYAKLIDDRKESSDWAVIRRGRETHWEELCQVQKGEKVLDAGCGNGDYTCRLLSKGAKVWAFDYAENMVLASEKRVAKYGFKIEKLTVDSVLNIPYPDEMFDKIVCLAVVDHLSDKDRPKAISELIRVLKPGGILFINTPNRFAYHWRIGHHLMRLLGRFPKGKIHWFTPRELKKLVRDAGLIPERSLGLEIIPPFSGIYTTDLRRYTIFPEWFILILDRFYLAFETRIRRIEPFKSLGLHYFLTARKPN